MKRKRMITLLFIIAAIYDGLLGCIFLLAGERIFEWFAVTPPNHPGYLHFPAALLVVFAIMFIAIARDPYANLNLLPYAILLKVSYCGVVLFHWLNTGIPGMWKPLWFFDLLFLALFIWTAAELRNEK
jgi:hypothetical protein